MEYRAKSIGTAALLLCVSFVSEAITLGTLRGSAVIGRPLEVTIPVQVEQADSAVASCFEAEVFHADVRQVAGRVRLSLDATGTGLSYLLRIKSPSLIDEPVVSVTLRSLCESQTERRYVLLADLPSSGDVSAPIQMAGTPPASSSSVRSPLGGSTPASSPPYTEDEKPVKPRRVARVKSTALADDSQTSASTKGDRASKRTTPPSVQ